MKQILWKPKIKYQHLFIEDNTVVLRPLQMKDFKVWQAGWMGRSKSRHQFDSGPRDIATVTKKDFKEKIKNNQARSKSHNLFKLDIFHKKSGEHLGFISIMVFFDELRWANLGYEIHNQHWKKGYATRASKLALKLAFTDLNLHRVEASCDPKNIGSKKVALSAGLKYEGRRKNFFINLRKRKGSDVLVFATNFLDYFLRVKGKR